MRLQSAHRFHRSHKFRRFGTILHNISLWNNCFLGKWGQISLLQSFHWDRAIMHCFIFGRLLSPAVEFPHTGEVAHSRSPDYHILGQPNHLVGSGISLLSLSITIRLSCPPSAEPSLLLRCSGISLIINIFLFWSITVLIMNYYQQAQKLVLIDALDMHFVFVCRSL